MSSMSWKPVGNSKNVFCAREGERNCLVIGLPLHGRQ